MSAGRPPGIMHVQRSKGTVIIKELEAIIHYSCVGRTNTTYLSDHKLLSNMRQKGFGNYQIVVIVVVSLLNFRDFN